MNSKYYPLIKLARQAALMKRRFTLPFRLIKSGFYKNPSYYPERTRKSTFRIFAEQLMHIFRYGAIEWHYFTYGFDIKGFRNRKDYMDDADFMWQNNMLNMVQVDLDYTCILRDKTLFGEILTMWGYNTPHTIAEIYSEKDAIKFLGTIQKGGGWFCKPINGQCGEGAFKIFVSTDEKCTIDNVQYSFEDAREMLKKRLSGTPYIIQNIIEQLPEISAIYPNALNTVRITTYYDKEKQQALPFSGLYRTGAKDLEVDNWAIGGVLIGLDVFTGKLGKYGFFKHGYGEKTDRHPDSGFVFENYQLPDYNQALQQAISLHEKLKGIPIIGWDIALTKDGPVFIEGNDNIEIGPLQISIDRGLKKEYSEIRKKCLGV